MRIGNRIKEIRKHKTKLAKKDVAWFLNISVNAYKYIENDRVDITLHQLQEIARVLEVKPEDILGYEGRTLCITHIHKNHFENRSGANQTISIVCEDCACEEATKPKESS